MMEWQETEIGKIPSDWGLTSIEDISEVVTDGAHASPKFFPNGRMMCSVKDMTYDGFEFRDCKTISQKNFEKLKKQNCSPQKGDILISKDGEKCLDLIFVYSQDDEIVLLSSIAIVRLNNENNSHFYRYFLLSPVGQSIMKKWFKSGTAIPRVVLKDFRNVPVPKVPLNEQINSSRVLETLDKKIKNLQHQNQTLEKIAQTLFKQWFVDFNFPDENGKPYKDNGGEMVASELGEIPKGWSVKTLDAIAINYDSKRIPLSSRQRLDRQGEYPYYGASGIVDYIDEYLFDGDYILFSEDGENLRSRKQPIVFLVDGKFWVNNHAHILKSKQDFYFHFMYLFLSHIDISHIITGAVQPKINKTNLHGIELSFPDNERICEFDNIISPLFHKIKTNKFQIQTLTLTRDTLLPKLMSGKDQNQRLMEKLKETISTYDAWEDLATYINRIETFLDTDFITSVENGKALIESICKTILKNTSTPYEETDSINKLVSVTFKRLGIFAEKQVSKFGSGLVTAMQNLGELRNTHGQTAHGKPIDELKNNGLEKISTAFLVNAVEVMAVFLIEYYELEFPNHEEKEDEDETIDYSHFNEFLDEEYGDVDIIGILYPTSEVLPAVDMTAYGVKYQEYLGEMDETI